MCNVVQFYPKKKKEKTTKKFTCTLPQTGCELCNHVCYYSSIFLLYVRVSTKISFDTVVAMTICCGCGGGRCTHAVLGILHVKDI